MISGGGGGGDKRRSQLYSTAKYIYEGAKVQ